MSSGCCILQAREKRNAQKRNCIVCTSGLRQMRKLRELRFSNWHLGGQPSAYILVYSSQCPNPVDLRACPLASAASAPFIPPLGGPDRLKRMQRRSKAMLGCSTDRISCDLSRTDSHAVEMFLTFLICHFDRVEWRERCENLTALTSVPLSLAICTHRPS